MNIENIQIIEMNNEHVKDVKQIERICFGPNWTGTDFYKELTHPNTYYFVATVHNKPIGYAGYWLILEEAHIISFGVLPEYRRIGIAKLLMLKIIEHCKSKGAKWITLEVKDTNLGAQELYKRFGFKILGKRYRYYQDDNRDAYVMWTENITSPEYEKFLEELKINYIYKTKVFSND